MMTPRNSISSILKKITVDFPTISKEEDRPKYTIQINGVLEELSERLEMAEKELILPTASNHRRNEFIIEETNSILRLSEKETKDTLFGEKYCQRRGEELHCWLLTNVPHGIFKAYADILYRHWRVIKHDQEIKEEQDAKRTAG